MPTWPVTSGMWGYTLHVSQRMQPLRLVRLIEPVAACHAAAAAALAVADRSVLGDQRPWHAVSAADPLTNEKPE